MKKQGYAQKQWIRGVNYLKDVNGRRLVLTIEMMEVEHQQLQWNLHGDVDDIGAK